jgi:lantibiotic modifying enzyme
MTQLPNAITPQAILPALNKISSSIDPAQYLSAPAPTLWSGQVGIALYLAALQKIDPACAHEADVLQLLSSALDEISNWPTPLILKNIWSLWAAREVDRFLGESDNTRFCRDLDDMLLEALQEIDAWDQTFDLIYGLAGIGGYGLCAAEDSCGAQIVERVFELLLPLACETDAHMWWPSNAQIGTPGMLLRQPQGYCDLGMAHGNAGVLAFLARALKQGLHAEPARACINKLVPWLLAQQNAPDCGSRFPYIAEDVNVPSRCAWCYGDPGIAWALLCAADAMHNPAWLESAHATARAISTRPLATMGFADSALCHGHAGVGHILRRIGQRLDDAQISAFANDLLQQAMQSARQADTESDMSFLEGQVGIGLALIAASTDLALNWDYPLLLA